MKSIFVATAASVLALVVVTPAAADICGQYRTAIDSYIAKSTDVFALKDTLESAFKGIRGARATRSAVNALDTESARRILAASGADVSEELAAARTASTAAIETFEAIHERVKAAASELDSVRIEELDAARIAADGAADSALDTLSRLKSVPRRGALKAASASAAATHGKTTSNALVSVHESIYRAACE